MAAHDKAFLSICDLNKSYGAGEACTQVLKGISSDIDKGEICVLFGPSGSGKSTFLNMVGGLEPADSGSIVVNGIDITKLSDRELVEYRRRELGFIFQFYNLVPDLTIRENIEVCQYLSKNPLCLVANSSAAPSAALSSRTQACCCATSQPAHSTTTPPRRFSS